MYSKRNKLDTIGLKPLKFYELTDAVVEKVAAACPNSFLFDLGCSYNFENYQ